jgi:UrcA family protein
MTSLRVTAFAISSCLLAGALLTPRISLADSSDQPPTKVVRYADLNLNTRAGVAVLYRRIKIAAREVCEPLEPPSSVLPSAVWQSCLSNAVATAVHDVAQPLLTAYYDEHDGGANRQRWLISTAGK